MEAAQNRYRLAFDHKVDQVRKPAHDGSPDVAVHLWVKTRVDSNPSEQVVVVHLNFVFKVLPVERTEADHTPLGHSE